MTMVKIRLRQVADSKHKSMSDIFRATGIAESTLSRINSGRYSPSLDTLQKIADFLNCNVTDLFTDEHQYMECPHCHKLIKINLEK